MFRINVFVGSARITDVAAALKKDVVTCDQFDLLAVFLNTRTNFPNVATPNSQSAFLFM